MAHERIFGLELGSHRQQLWISFFLAVSLLHFIVFIEDKLALSSAIGWLFEIPSWKRVKTVLLLKLITTSPSIESITRLWIIISKLDANNLSIEVTNFGLLTILYLAGK